jgi:dephospho-CoA kinase
VIILGLTGSIAMGKSTVAAEFRRLGVPVHDADAAVHRLLGPKGGAVAAVGAAFPGVVQVTPRGPAVDRAALGRIVFADPARLRALEAILHPAVRTEERRFLAVVARRGCRLAVLDIPLLFETGSERRCDAVAVVSAPSFVQRERVLRRPGMNAARLAAVLTQQMPDAEKRRRADFIIPTSQGRRFSLRATCRILAESAHWRGRHWPPLPTRDRKHA